VKDLDGVEGVRCTFGSTSFREYVPGTTSPVVRRLLDAGMVLVGKTNTPEFGASALTDNRLVGPTSSPLAPSCNSGGSSGGAAAAVAAGMVAVSHGSDGGGSIRIPASWCGVYGIKPQFGRVPTVARPNGMAHSPFAQAGPLTRTVADAALALDAMAGPHAGDPFSLPRWERSLVEQVRELEHRMPGTRIVHCPSFGGFPLADDVGERVAAAVTRLRRVGFDVTEEEIDWGVEPEQITGCWRRLIAIGSAYDLTAFAAGVGVTLSRGDELHPRLERFIRLGEESDLADLKAAERVRTRVFDALEGLLARFDVILAPVTGIGPVRNRPGEITTGPEELVDGPAVGFAMTHPLNLSGHPAAAVPVGRLGGGEPVGMQVIGRRFAEAQVLALSACVERALPWRAWYDEVDQLVSAAAG
jgi:amidase/aspartyl-tRNA(Asn)/glutamyl-tRNA(Gln) amidotransferase subunit A